MEFRALLPSQKAPLPNNGLWIVFCDKDQHFSTPLCEALRTQNQRVISISAGAEFQQISPHDYIVCATKIIDYNKIFDGLAQKNIEGIIYLWSMEQELPERMSIAYLKKKHRFSCEGLLMLLKALSNHISQKNPMLWIINQSSQGFGGARFLMDGPMAWLTGAILTEHPELNCHRLILETQAPLEDNIDRCIDAFKSEDLEEQVMWLNGAPSAGRLIRFKLPEVQKAVVLDPEATYVVVGGCGGLGTIGLYVSRWHVEHGAKNLLMLDPVEVSRESQGFIQAMRDKGIHIDLEIIDVTNSPYARSHISRPYFLAPA